MRCTLGLPAFVLLASLATARFSASVSADEPQYEAVWADGKRETVDAPPLWIARERKPQLGQKSILDEATPLRRVYRLGAAAQPHVAERVEFLGGDRLTGRIVEYLPETTDGVSRPGCLVVEPLAAVDEPVASESVRIRVPVERVRRVVWDESTPRPFRPGTFFYRDGRRTTFRSLRWAPGALKLLVDQGIEEVPWDEAAEVHLTERDPWEEYADQLAVLMPELASRVVRFETPGGMRVTVSSERIRAVGDVAKPESQTFSLYPAWSLDPIAIPERLTAAQLFFAPHEVSLSNFEPSAYLHRSHLAGGWNQWRADQNVQGNPLAAGDHEFGWGLGVHAFAALEFTVPPWVKTFRTSAALDRAAGDGGSVRARVYFGPTATAANPGAKPLAESPVLVGTGQSFDSGRLALAQTPGRVHRLVLVADSLPVGAPPEADPLDLRDVFDWLEPLVELDQAALKAAVTKHAASLFVRRHRWVVQGTYADAWRWENASPNGHIREIVAAVKGPLIVSRTLVIPEDAEQLAVYAAPIDDAAGPVTVKWIISGQTVGETTVPKSGDAKPPAARPIPIPENRRGREAKCELHFTAPKPGLRIDFHGVGLVLAKKKE